ncbi:MAG: GntR family transcriptional regulator [Chloroflexota bacterium]
MGFKHNPNSLSYAAYHAIRKKIVTLKLPPGKILDENELQTELDLGRTPIREALKRLEIEKLVTILPRRGMFVTDISILDLQRLFEVRLNLESLAAKLAASRGKESHWQKMATALAKADQTFDSDSNKDLNLEIDEACHLIMYDAADNEFLKDNLQILYTLSLRMWYFALTKTNDTDSPVVKSSHITDHQFIYEAMKSKDGNRAAELMQKHILAYQNDIQRIILHPTGE